MTYPTTIDLKIKINAVDVTAYVPRDVPLDRELPGLEITQEMGRTIDSCMFALMDASALSIQELHEVVITNDAETETYFAGVLIYFEDFPVATEVDIICECADYTFMLEKSIINQEWEDTADNTILSNIATNAEPALSDFDFSTNVVNLGTVPRLRLARRTVRESLDELAARVGAEW